MRQFIDIPGVPKKVPHLIEHREKGFEPENFYKSFIFLEISNLKMELRATTLHVHAPDKTREISTESCFMTVKGDSLKNQHKR